jgi:hypothetical protein
MDVDEEEEEEDEDGSNNLIFGGAYPPHSRLDLIHLVKNQQGGDGEVGGLLGITHLWQDGLPSSHLILLFLTATSQSQFARVTVWQAWTYLQVVHPLNVLGAHFFVRVLSPGMARGGV